MACHESIKDLLHKTLGLNGAGFPDMCDSGTPLELSSTAEITCSAEKVLVLHSSVFMWSCDLLKKLLNLRGLFLCHF